MRSLIDRVRAALAKEPGLQEKRMSGSVGFMVRGKLCIGAREERLLCRVDPELQSKLVKEKGAMVPTPDKRNTWLNNWISL